MAPEGSVWVSFWRGRDQLTVLRWDGEAWASYGPVSVGGPATKGPRGVRGEIHFIGVDAIWFDNGVAALDGSSIRPLELLPEGLTLSHPLVTAQDGRLWAVTSGGHLYVITPEAVAGAE